MRASPGFVFASLLFTTGLLLAVVPAGCSESEGCQSARDCPSGMQCENKVCILDPSNVGGFRDGGPQVRDTGVHMDAETPDAGPPPDGGPLPDGGPVADGGPADGGLSTFDGGPVATDASTLPAQGYLTYYELTTTMAEAGGWAEFYDRSAAVYTTSEQSFMDGEGTSCTVRLERLSSGATAGLTAQNILFRDVNGVLRRELVPDPANAGRFIPATSFVTGFFDLGGEVNVDINSNGTPGMLGEISVVAARPRALFFVSMPSQGLGVNLLAGVTFMWATDPGDATIELYDANREVVLRCVINDDGQYTIPLAAIQAWFTHGPTAPATLELRHDAVLDFAVPIEGSATDVVLTKLVVSRGYRWPAY